jgi:hypothetical protein
VVAAQLSPPVGRDHLAFVARTDRIQVNIQDQAPGIDIFFDQVRLEPSLIKMTGPPVSPVEPHGIGRLEPPDSL